MKKYVNGEFVDLMPEEVKQIQDLENFSWGVEETNQGELELIADVTIEEEVANVSISVDKNGKPFKLKKALLFWFFPKYEGDSEIPSFYFSETNGVYSAGNKGPLVYTSCYLPAAKSTTKRGFWNIEIDVKNKIRYEKCARYSTSENNIFFGTDGSNYSFKEWYRLNDDELIKSIGLKAGLAFEGCKFILYGVRA